jgi:hypothetical protein
MRHWNDHVKEIVNGKREAFKKCLSTGKMEDKIGYSHKRTGSVWIIGQKLKNTSVKVFKIT